MNAETSRAPFEGWAVLELMGHRKLAGRVSEANIAGTAFVRIDVPGPADKDVATQFYAPAAIYCITPTTEGIARGLAKRHQPEPVTRFELPAPDEDAPSSPRHDFDDEDDEV